MLLIILMNDNKPSKMRFNGTASIIHLFVGKVKIAKRQELQLSM